MSTRFARLFSRAALAASLYSQDFRATLTGLVTDPSGAMVAGATLQLENANTKDIRVQTSSKDGSYSFTNLLPGTYKLSVSAAGFKD